MPENRSSFTYRLRVRYAEVDSQGIVFNANYLLYFDVAVSEYFRARLRPYREFVEKEKIDFHVSHAELDYKSPARMDDDVDIELGAVFSGAQAIWNFTMRRAETLLCTGSITYVCIDAVSGKVKRIPAPVAEKLGWIARV